MSSIPAQGLVDFRSRRRFAAFAACCLLALPALSARLPPPPPPQPYAVVPAAPLGYKPLGSLYLLLRLSSVSLDFIDNDHLLFTFHNFRLMSRETEQGHDDQMIRAVTLEVPTGKIDAATEWRMHDRRRYLYPVGDGTFLLRRGEDIDRVDKTLVAQPYLRFEHRIESVQISPDGKMITVQSDRERHSQEKHRQLVEEAIANGEQLPDEDVNIQMVRLDAHSIRAEAKSDSPLLLAVTSTGYIEQQKSGIDQWKLRFNPFEGKPRVLDEVHSTCTPSEDFVSADTLLLILCSDKTEDRLATAVTTEGRELWNGEWTSNFTEPNLGLSASGRDFAISWIVASRPIDAFFSLSDGDVVGQTVQVLSTATGHLLLSVKASPVVSGGQNFALSADGSRLAVLNNGAIELYKVPPDKPN